tara:strand:- start:444 stop:830 length:387 start_codon:yes stop_codon:yes gene_type:complete
MRTWEQLTEREQLLTYISDVHKDAYGFRPRGSYDNYSVVELKAELDRLCEIAEEEYKRQQELEAEAYKALHKHLADLVSIGARDFKQALAWDIQAEECEHDGFVDFGFYCYKKGIAYNKQRVLERLAA